MASLNVTLDVTKLPDLMATIRQQFAELVRQAASKETDAKVVAHLHVIAAAVAQSMSYDEAAERMKNPPVTGLPRMGQQLATPPKTSLDAVGTAGGKATVETLKR